jgi:hypothetical protein
VPTVVVTIFALQQVTRYDLHKLGTVPLRHAPVQRARDRVVAAADRFASMFERLRHA